MRATVARRFDDASRPDQAQKNRPRAVGGVEVVSGGLQAELLEDGWQELRKQDGTDNPHDDAVLGISHIGLGGEVRGKVAVDVVKPGLDPDKPIPGVLGELFKFGDSGFHVAIVAAA